MASTLRVPTEFTAVDKFTSVVVKMTAGVSNFSKASASAVTRVNTKVNGLWNSMDNLSQLALGGGIVAGFGMAGKAVMDYEDALASLQAVTGTSSTLFKGQIESIAKNTNKSAIEVAKSFEIVGSSMSEYLDNPKALGQITNASIILSKASGEALEPSIDNLTSIMNQFNLSAEKASYAVNRLTAGEIVGSVRTADLAKNMKEVGGVAYFNGIKLGEMTAAMEVMGKRIPHEQLGRVSRNLVTFMSTAKAAPKAAIASMDRLGISTDVLMNKNLTFEQRLKELSKAKDDAIAMEALFGKENISGATQLLNNIKLYSDWNSQIEKTNKAQEQAAVNSNTLSKGIEAIKNAFINNIVSGNKNNSVLEKLKNIAFFVANNMDTILTVVTSLIGAFVVFKTVVLAIQAVQGVIKAYEFITKAATAAQWLWNAAMWANPMGMLIAGIIALIGLITLIIAKWNEWGAALAIFTGPLGFVISLVQSFRRNWEMVKEAFQTDGIIGGLKAIGLTILDALLMPVQQLLELISKLPGVGDIAKGAAEKIKALRLEMGTLEAPETKQVKATANATVKGQVNVNVAAKGGATAQTDSRSFGGVPVKTTSTQGGY